jgi:transposase InsO family protein
MDSGATAHMVSSSGILSFSHPSSTSTPSTIIVGDGSALPVMSTSSAHIGSLHLNNALVAPHIIKNLVSVPQITTDNNCSVEFDPFGFSVKDLRTRRLISRCNSTGSLYPLLPPASTTTPSVLLANASSQLWHRRLGHLGHEALSKLAGSSAITCNNGAHENLYHACQLGRHVRLPFSTLQSRASHNFDLVHCDLWTSPVSSVSGFKYYLAILDGCSHYLWTFPLHLKSDTFSTIAHFFSFVATQFGTTIKSVQCDNGREFDNSSTRQFFLTHGVVLCMSCPYTSQQNGKAERVLRTINNIIRSHLFQSHLPPPYWVEGLHTATYLFNRQPSKTLQFFTPHHVLYGHPPSYSHLRVFGCKCYPNTSATAPHKLAPRSILCVFLGYSSDHKGYQCLDTSTNRVIISRHVIFDESSFPFTDTTPMASHPPSDLDFLDDFHCPDSMQVIH